MTATTTATASKPLAAGLVKKTTAYNVDPRRVTRREGWNTRFDMGEIAALAASIETELNRDPSDGGLLMPIRVKRISGNPAADFELVDGDRRLTAIELLLEKGVVFPQGVAATMVDKNQDDLTSTIQMITANTGKPFLPLEEAAAYKRLRDGGMSVAQICAAVGRTDVHVRETLDLLEADAAVQDAVKTGAVAGSMAKLIVSVTKGDNAAQKDLLADAVGAKKKDKAAKARLMTKIQQKRDAKAVAKGKEVKMRALTDAQLSEIGERLAKHLKALLKEAGLGAEMQQGELVEWVKKDEKLAAAYVAGAMDALKAAAGVKINLEV